MPHQPARSPKNSRRQKLLIGLSLILGSLCLTISIVEGAVRLLAPPYPSYADTLLTCDNTLGWVGKPNLAETFETEHFSQQLHFNSAGMHDTDHALEKPASTIRILMLGDSFVQAVQVAEAATAHQVLEDDLNRRTGQPVEVISGGVINWGTNQQLLYYRNQGYKFQPDLVLLMFYIGNDVLDNLPGNVMTVDGFNCYAPYLTSCEGVFDPVPLTYAPGLSSAVEICGYPHRTLINTLGWLYQRSRLYQQLEPLIVARQPRRTFGQAYPSPFSALYLPHEEPALAEAWNISQATISQLKQEVEGHGTQFAIALISPDVTVRLTTLSAPEREVFLRDNPTYATAEIERPNRRLAEFLTTANIPFIDLTEPMAAHLWNDSTPLYLVGDGHWTEAGNRVAGEALAEWLIRAKLLGLVSE